LSEEQIRARIAAVPFWFHQVEVAPGIVTPGIDPSAAKLEQLKLPADLSGKRVLDIGACDGFFSFECERRGAEVIAIDGNLATGFGVVRELIGSQVPFSNLDIYDLSPDAFGSFDLVLCLGVLYHLRHPLLGLERIHAVCRGQLILETAICDHHFVDTSGAAHELASLAPGLTPIPIAQFYPGGELNRDTTSWWSPNLVALHSMLRSVGFEPYQTIIHGPRACIHCLRVESPQAEEWANTRFIGNPLVQQPDASVPGPNGATVQASADHHQPARAADHASLELLAQTMRMQSEQTLQLQRALADRDARIADLETRARQLEDQAREARRVLAAVENGRLLRIMRWLAGVRRRLSGR
jgi:tRNA (mo5U34)-methyltransferase